MSGVDPRLLEILVCPLCKGKLVYRKDAAELVCKADRLGYPVKDGIPVMLEEEARKLPPEEEVGVKFHVVIPARYASTPLSGQAARRPRRQADGGARVRARGEERRGGGARRHRRRAHRRRGARARPLAR